MSPLIGVKLRRESTALRFLRGVLVVVFAGVAVFGAAACATDGSTGESSEPTRPAGPLSSGDRETVVVIGDSISAQGKATIERVLGSDRVVIVDGRSGYRVGQQIPSAESLASGPTDQVIVELGTNDVMQGWDLERSAEDLGRIVDLFSDARCIHLVMVSETMPSEGGEAATRARRLNSLMKEIATIDPRVGLIDVPNVVDHFERVDPGRRFTVDGVHPTDEGQEALVDAYGAALDSC